MNKAVYNVKTVLFVRSSTKVRKVAMSVGLLVQKVSKAFKGQIILHEIDLTVQLGEVVLLKGPNGSGKSTLVHLISGIYRLEIGDIRVGGISLRDEPRRAKAAVTTIFQETLFDPLSSPLQALSLHTRFYGARWSKKQIQQALEEFGITEPTRPIFQLSGGTKKKVELLKARLTETPIYLFDEPFAGLDEASRKQAEEMIRTRKRQGKAILLVSHDPGKLDFVDRTVYLEAGRIVSAESAKEVLQMRIEAIVRGWKEEYRAALEPYLVEAQKLEPTEDEIHELLKSLGLDRLGKPIQVIRAEGAAAQELLKGPGGAVRTIAPQQTAAFRTKLRLAGELSLAQAARLLEEHGLEVLELRQV
jgi:ABC-2 type transport system ATP-binding protein